ncbi:MAG: SDR family oxidoreductase [Chloroflexota bacterium]|nr:SDR family oxidoreductase [Chloroflexota bacterium]
MQLKPINEQVVVVCGASSGIGREAALRFGRQGAKVVVSARSEPGLRSLVDEIRAEGGEATAIPADVSDFDQVRAIADGAVQQYGRLDTWVHAAAVLLYATFEDTTPEEFERVVDVNLMGQVYGAMAALPHLKREGRGALIHISSIEARRALPYHSAYAAAKHGIDGFLEAMRVELRKEGVPVSVTQILPATINTPLFSKARTKIGVKPMGAPPFYPPGSVADAILYAAEHPRRDIVVGGVGKQLVTTQRLSPRLMDEILLRVGFRLQRTNEPKSADAPDNLFAPIQGYDRSEGDFGKLSFRRSLYTWLQRHPTLKATAMLGAAAGAAAIIDGRTSATTRTKEQ